MSAAMGKRAKMYVSCIVKGSVKIDQMPDSKIQDSSPTAVLDNCSANEVTGRVKITQETQLFGCVGTHCFNEIPIRVI